MKKNARWMGIAVYVGANCLPNAAVADTDIEQDMCAKLPEVIKNGNKLYQIKEYDKARKYFIEQVSLSEGCNHAFEKPDKAAIVTAYNNVALSYIKEGDSLKARAWLSLAPNDKKSKFNYGLLENIPVTNGGNIVGTYWQYAGLGGWNVASVEKQGNNYDVSLSLLYFGLRGMAYGPNIGDISQVVAVKNDVGIIKLKSEEGNCEISMRFSDANSGTLSIKTSPEMKECGFGHNVYAYGDFVRVSYKPTSLTIDY
ncbi:tetratricopeptide repeat protein [Aeromonas tecta]|uniref:tetratricopeptide repeat protein n=1 Tax=Aeromonas tecta TaxID=324617 RepID=UPI000A8C2EE7|nr:tetratricopeptide repeat protein [Aeromonas tecta]